MLGISPEVLSNASPDLLALLGFELWRGMGVLRVRKMSLFLVGNTPLASCVQNKEMTV